MAISNKLVIVSIIVLLGMCIFTLFNINDFMTSEKKCESVFSIINKCKCFPDDNITKLFNVNVDLDRILTITENGTK
jgi:hypothetical protein